MRSGEMWDGMHGLYYDRQGREISLRTFTELLSNDPKYRQLGYDELRTSGGRRVYVSTIWTGINMGMWRIGRLQPVIFETMALDYDLGPEDDGFIVDEGNRYSTERQAFLGHQEVLGRVAQGWWLDLGGRA